MSGPTARRASHRDRLSERVGGEWGPGIGGLSEAALLMDASGRDVILLEAVGVGQAEVDCPSDEDSGPDPQVWVSGSWWW